jgi:hypothetical protein
MSVCLHRLLVAWHLGLTLDHLRPEGCDQKTPENNCQSIHKTSSDKDYFGRDMFLPAAITTLVERRK